MFDGKLIQRKTEVTVSMIGVSTRTHIRQSRTDSYVFLMLQVHFWQSAARAVKATRFTQTLTARFPSAEFLRCSRKRETAKTVPAEIKIVKWIVVIVLFRYCIPLVSRAIGAQTPSSDLGNLACRRRSTSPIKRPLNSFGVNPVLASSPKHSPQIR